MSLKFRYRILRDGNGKFKAQYRTGWRWHSICTWTEYLGGMCDQNGSPGFNVVTLFPSWTKAEDALLTKHEDLVRAERARTWTTVREGELND